MKQQSHKKSYHPPKVGMRIIKTALAVLVTLLIIDFLLGRLILGRDWAGSLNITIFAIISTVITMQSSVKETVKAARERIIGTLIGVVIGLAFLALAVLMFDTTPETVAVLVFYALLTIGTLLVIYLCKVIKFAIVSSLCVVVFISVMYAVNSNTPLVDAIWRVLGTIVGAIIAIVINAVVFPPKINEENIMSDTYAYKFEDNLYLNITNRCSNDCTFCVRQGGSFGGQSLWLKTEPTTAQVIEAIKTFDPDSYNQIVFCGYGESTYRMDCMVEVGKWIKDNLGKTVRLNTNGLGNLINGRDILPELKGAVDSISVSLNQYNASKYEEVSKSVYGESAFDEVLDFAKKSKDAGFDTQMSIVACIPKEDIAECYIVCDKLGMPLRVRGQM
ncbi:MAG: TatD family nuclease-associated radical SAM protein [Firmicutes bacterium]|nr:TatD family nuclease-associated radical SAM protein [Bacillota bacterium]